MSAPACRSGLFRRRPDRTNALRHRRGDRHASDIRASCQSASDTWQDRSQRVKGAKETGSYHKGFGFSPFLQSTGGFPVAVKASTPHVRHLYLESVPRDRFSCRRHLHFRRRAGRKTRMARYRTAKSAIASMNAATDSGTSILRANSPTKACAMSASSVKNYSVRSTIIFLISAIALAGFSPLGQVLAQFMMVWQRYSLNGSCNSSRRSPVASSRLSISQR